MQVKKESCKKKILFLIVLGMFSLAIFIKSYGQGMSETNTSALALTYQNGLFPNALLGTIYQILNDCFHGRLLNYPMAMRFAESITVVQYAILFLFFFLCIKSAPIERLNRTGELLVFFSIFSVPFYCGYDLFGSSGPCLLSITLIYAMFVIKGTWNPVLYLVPIVGMLLETEYIFSYFGVFLVFQFYAYFKEENIDQKKSWKRRIVLSSVIVVFLGICLMIVPAFYQNSREITIETAKKISEEGRYSETFLNRIWFGYRFGGDMAPHGGNILELMFMVILFMPYLILGIRLFKSILRKAGECGESLCYRIMIYGGGMVLPLFLLHCHYGKWFFTIISYYAVMFLVLLAKRDNIVENSVYMLMDHVKKRHAWMILLLIYPIMFVPFSDMNICGITRTFAQDVKTIFQIIGIM